MVNLTYQQRSASSMLFRQALLGEQRAASVAALPHWVTYAQSHILSCIHHAATPSVSEPAASEPAAPDRLRSALAAAMLN